MRGNFLSVIKHNADSSAVADLKVRNISIQSNFCADFCRRFRDRVTQRAQAAYLVTRDKDLLSLQHYEGITMITPEAFIAIVREHETGRTEGNTETGEIP